MPIDVNALIKKAKSLVVTHYNNIPGGQFRITEDEVFVVWFSKTLQNWKAMIATTYSDGIYYEVTYNGDNEETYLDVYKKLENVRIAD